MEKLLGVPIVFFGAGESGKTVTMNSVIGENFIDYSPTTFGFSVKKTAIQKKPILLLEVGGQNIQFFVAENELHKIRSGLVAIVYNTKRVNEIELPILKSSVDKYLGIKNYLFPDSQVLLIGTHSTKDKEVGILQHYQSEPYHNITDELFIDNKTQKGIQDLRETLFQMSQNIKEENIQMDDIILNQFAALLVHELKIRDFHGTKKNDLLPFIEKINTRFNTAFSPDTIMNYIISNKLVIQRNDEIIHHLLLSNEISQTALEVLEEGRKIGIVKIESSLTRIIYKKLFMDFDTQIVEGNSDFFILKEKEETTVINESPNGLEIIGNNTSDLFKAVYKKAQKYLKEFRCYDKADQTISCPCSTCKNKPSTGYFYNVQSLIKRHEKSYPSIACGNTGDDIAMSEFENFLSQNT